MGSDNIISLGLRRNLRQFTLLVIVNACVGALVGFYSLVSLIGQRDFALVSNIVILSYVLSFGMAKAFCNYYAGTLADRVGRRKILMLGWFFGVPVPLLIIIAPNWWWIVFANALLGINQGFAWSMTVVMKVDLVGPRRRGLAMGLNEFAGYLALSLTLLASGYLAELYGLRPVPFYLGIAITILGATLSVLFVRETRAYALFEAERRVAVGHGGSSGTNVDPNSVFLYTTLHNRALSASCQAGLVNNLIFGMSWGLFPLLFAAHGLNVQTINFVKAFYPGVWGVMQLLFGPLSDRLGRKWLIVLGQLIQAIALWLTVSVNSVNGWIVASGLLGLGTALVYPALLAAVSDVANPVWRGAALGTYRFWRDSGYAIGAVFSGTLADLFNISFAIMVVGWLAVVSALAVALRMYETLPRKLSMRQRHDPERT